MAVKTIFTVDGKTYSVRVKRLKRSGVVTDGDNAGRLSVSLEMFRDILGTFYNYTLELDAETMAVEEYDELYDILTDPDIEFHMVSFPYGQSFLTFKAYVTKVDDELKTMTETLNRWGNTSIDFVAQKPQREAH